MTLGTVGRRRLLLLGALVAVALLAWRPVDHGDTFIYQATGRWIADHHAIAHTDPFSWTQVGRAWQSNAWGWGVVLWLADAVGGLAAVAALKPVFIVLTGLATVWASRVFGARQVPAYVAAPLALVVITPWISDRPQLASFALYPLTLAAAHLAGRGGRLRGWWLVAVGALFVVWVNVHSVALFGVMAVAALEAGVVVDRLWARHRSGERTTVGSIVGVLMPPAAVVVTAAAATLVNPWGLGLHRHSLEVRRLSASTISEWYPLVKSGPVMIIPIAVAVAVAAIAVTAGARRRAELILPLVLTAVLTVDAIRNAPFLVLGAAVLATPMLSRRKLALGERRDLALVGVVAALVISLVLAVPHIVDSGDAGPNIAVASTRALPAGCHLRNDYRLGGYVIWDRPDVPVSADGRNDLYGLDGYDQNVWFENATAAASAPAAFRAEGTDCVLAAPDSPLVPVLEADGWTVVGTDPIGVALVR